MKQTEKLDVILKDLYDHRHDGMYYSLTEICTRLNIPVANFDEIKSFGHRLKDDGYIKAIFIHYDVSATLTSHGIDYCEDSSYSMNGNAIIHNTYNLEITNSPNANIVTNSTNVNIQTTNYAEVRTIIGKIKDALKERTDITETKRNDILECVDEVDSLVESGKKSKFSMAALVEMAGSLSEVGLLVIELSRILGH